MSTNPAQSTESTSDDGNDAANAQSAARDTAAKQPLLNMQRPVEAATGFRALVGRFISHAASTAAAGDSQDLAGSRTLVDRTLDNRALDDSSRTVDDRALDDSSSHAATSTVATGEGRDPAVGGASLEAAYSSAATSTAATGEGRDPVVMGASPSAASPIAAAGEGQDPVGAGASPSATLSPAAGKGQDSVGGGASPSAASLTAASGEGQDAAGGGASPSSTVSTEASGEDSDPVATIASASPAQDKATPVVANTSSSPPPHHLSNMGGTATTLFSTTPPRAQERSASTDPTEEMELDMELPFDPPAIPPMVPEVAPAIAPELPFDPPAIPPMVPPVAPAIAQAAGPREWTCVCGVINTKKRCRSCFKWEGGKRGKLKTKKRNKTASPPPTARGRRGATHDNEVVNITPRGADSSAVSAMTGNEEESTCDGNDDASIYTDSSTTTMPESNDAIREMMQKEMNATGDGGDSDEDGDGFNLMMELLGPAQDSRHEQKMEDRDLLQTTVEDSIENCLYSECSTGEPQCNLPGAPTGWHPPGPKDGWNYKCAGTKGEPEFKDVDNPGGWSNYTLKAKFGGARGTGSYSHHAMPAGAKVVPVVPSTGKRTQGPWEFHYTGWKHPAPTPKLTREGATRSSLQPNSRTTKLDEELLKRMGLTKKRMQEGDALFFWQLLLPLHDPAKSGIEGDPRKAFYCDVAEYTNNYAVGVKKWNGTYSDAFKPTMAEELVRWDGTIIRNSNTFVGWSWSTDSVDSNHYDPVIANAMSFRRHLDIRACIKLCLHHEEKKKGETGFDPTQKYKLAWDVPIFNLNQFIKIATTDVTIDETTWGNGSPSEMHKRLRNKPYNKGGQHTVVADARKRYILAHTARSNHYGRQPPFTREGPSEVKRLIDLINPLVVGQSKAEDDMRRQIFPEKPCLGMDNHFSGDDVDNYLGSNGYKAIMTRARNRLPKECKVDSFHHAKAVPVDARSKMARYENPVVSVKHVTPEKGDPFCVVHVSFQSTGSTNITAINALAEVQLYVREKERGRGTEKRVWAIEMNEARDLYLFLYGGVDKIDQMLKEWNTDYVTWRWWHAPMKHFKSITGVMAYQMYLDCASGELDADWKVDKPMSHVSFRQKLGEQLCKYTAAKCKYPGDEFCRKFKKMNRRQRARKNMAQLVHCDDGENRVSYEQYLDAKYPRGRDKVSRLCSGEMENLKIHLRSMERTSKGKCQVCGRDCWKACRECEKLDPNGGPVYCCFKDPGKKDKHGEPVTDNMVSCCMDLHNDHFFGLCMNDRRNLFGENKNAFKKATRTQIRKNKAHIVTLQRQKFLDDVTDN